jgi:hypothetical protein
MQYSMFLDDLREPSKEYDVIVRSFEEAIEIISKKGIPSHISFDHDLGLDNESQVEKNGYDVAKWVIEQVLDGVLEFPPNFSYNIHSANPVGAKNIDMLFRNYFEKI